jgi:hypothetical protein
MSRFVHLLRTPDARYAMGAVVSWLIYGALCTVMMFDQALCSRRRTFVDRFLLRRLCVPTIWHVWRLSREARLREIGHYAVGVVGLSTQRLISASQQYSQITIRH